MLCPRLHHTPALTATLVGCCALCQPVVSRVQGCSLLGRKLPGVHIVTATRAKLTNDHVVGTRARPHSPKHTRCEQCRRRHVRACLCGHPGSEPTRPCRQPANWRRPSATASRRNRTNRQEIEKERLATFWNPPRTEQLPGNTSPWRRGRCCCWQCVWRCSRHRSAPGKPQPSPRRVWHQPLDSKPKGQSSVRYLQRRTTVGSWSCRCPNATSTASTWYAAAHNDARMQLPLRQQLHKS